MEKEPIMEKDEASFPPRIMEVINARNIATEDFPLIEKLRGIPPDRINLLFHNFFTGYQEKSVRQLEIMLQGTPTAEQREAYEALLPFAKKYDRHACHHLIRVLEAGPPYVFPKIGKLGA